MIAVSRETRAALDIYVTELKRWQTRTNLVSNASLDDAWIRHVDDGLQLLAHAPAGSLTWTDLGTGGGSPGLVIGIALKERPGSHVHLVEANAKKCAFLRHVAALTKAPVTVHDTRIERFFTKERLTDVVSARALARLDQLLAWSAPVLAKGTLGLFPKGATVEEELAEARKHHVFTADLVPSQTSAEAKIVCITHYGGATNTDIP